MVVPPGEPVRLSELLQPKVEGELAFILDRDLPTPCTVLDVLQATRLVVPALEIIDSRIADWKIKLPDTVADNASSGRVVLDGRGRAGPTRAGPPRSWAWSSSATGEMLSSGAGASGAGQPRRRGGVARQQARRSSTIQLKAGEDDSLRGGDTPPWRPDPATPVSRPRFGCGLGSDQRTGFE